MREYLQSVAPDLGDPIPNGSPTIPAVLDPSVVASDVHRFLELVRLAPSAPRDQAIAAYEAALDLYSGVRTSFWENCTIRPVGCWLAAQ